MNYLSYQVYDVFTRTAYAGNPLAVFRLTAPLSGSAMQRIAGEMNLSESIFLLPGDEFGTFSARIFTPANELPIAGHPIIGAAIAVRDAGFKERGLTLNVQAGSVKIEYRDDMAMFQAPARAHIIDHDFENGLAARLLGLDRQDILSTCVASGGVPFAMIKVASRDALGRIALSTEIWAQHFDGGMAANIYAYCRGAGEACFHSRMFAPRMGIAEDPATGGAAMSLSALLPPGEYIIHQGEDMGRPSEIFLSAGDAGPVIGGQAVKLAEGKLAPPET